MSNKLLKLFLIGLIVIGICLRFYHIDRKIYWHDEVYTSFRSGGYSRGEIDNELFQNKYLPVQELQQYLSIKPNSNISNTIASLAQEDPQHPPLYFVVMRFWMRLFGSSIFVARLLPVIISLVSLPMIYLLSLELFGTYFNSQTSNYPIGLIALTTTALLSISPVDMLFAQTARQYSALTLSIISCSYLLLRALRLQNYRNWIYYALGIAASLYIHPFFGLNLIAFSIFIILFFRKQIILYLASSALGIVLYLPWIFVIVSNFQRVLSTTNWASGPIGFDYLVKLWILSFSSLFFDLDLGFNNIFTYICRLPFLILIGISIYFVYKNCSKLTSGFLITAAAVPFLVLVLPDLILGGKRSAVTRYLISCFPFIQIMVGFLLAKLLTNKRPIGIFVFTSLIVASITSLIVSSQAFTWWCKDLSFNNATISDRVNKIQSPLIISDIGDDFTNTGDLISLSTRMNPDVKLLLLKSGLYNQLNYFDQNPIVNESAIFVFRSSENLRTVLKQKATFDYLPLK